MCKTECFTSSTLPYNKFIPTSKSFSNDCYFCTMFSSKKSSQHAWAGICVIQPITTPDKDRSKVRPYPPPPPHPPFKKHTPCARQGAHKRILLTRTATVIFLTLGPFSLSSKVATWPNMLPKGCLIALIPTKEVGYLTQHPRPSNSKRVTGAWNATVQANLTGLRRGELYTVVSLWPST